MKTLYIGLLTFFVGVSACNSQTPSKPVATPSTKSIAQFDTASRTIHIFVALCDNQYQGIVPVPAKIGNGQDPNNNLYWGCAFGIRTYFKNSKDWKLLKTIKRDSLVMERLVFKHHSKNWYLVADAYNGKYIQQCTVDFLNGTCGKLKDTLHINNTVIGLAGNSKMLSYIGHDGLMDFQLNADFKNTDGNKRDIAILACYSKSYFAQHLQNAKVNPMLWTTGLMCPEAYTIHDAINAYLNNEGNEGVRSKGAAAYAKYQKCSEKAARGLLVTGW